MLINFLRQLRNGLQVNIEANKKRQEIRKHESGEMLSKIKNDWSKAKNELKVGTKKNLNTLRGNLIPIKM
jgi:hypothetical protein